MKRPLRPQIDVKRYRGQWVAVHPKTYEIISHGVSLDVAERAARARGVPDPIFLPVPKSDAYFVGTGA